ncbi:hypothetical protein K443DRAFT_133505 [Laccaria amethystina LaAM-08-1]|uniref:Uncharacterized protein n=1 Tax=Laccaria amethystina LaAM-08-1 TaxID=1095629 RepID=A0A0C9X9W6_9AGAR|nr:hypothetical protein K443DRAFT_133505 [Laccaria amethystina LaAM-08-1]
MATQKQGKATEKAICEFCGHGFSPYGIGSHKKACQKRWENERVDQQATHATSSEPLLPLASDMLDQARPDSAPPLEDGIKTEYHPHSSRITRIDHFNEYGFPPAEAPKPKTLDEPWHPFRSCIDFKFAEIALKSHLNKKTVNTLIKILHACSSGAAKFTLNSHDEMWEILQGASNKLTPSAIPTRGLSIMYPFYYRSLWDWGMDLVKNPFLASLFEWDAQRLFKFDGKTYVRFFHEPWTGDKFWKAQSSLPAGGKPLCYILYADKSKLSSFGSKMGYPVIAKIANLPSEISNGQGLGGGSVVGWLPIVEDDEGEKGKKGYVDFKRVIWHESFRILLESIQEYSKVGCWVECGDGVQRHLFPMVFILSADYEEQCIMALIWGSNGLCPCPISQDSEATYNEEKMPQRLGDAESLMKDLGLWFVKNAFWSIKNSDPHPALSWDRMHSYPGGLGGKHILPQIQLILKGTCETAKKADDQIGNLPHWRNLNHFDHVTSVTFSDARKYEDVLKMVIFATHNIITHSEHPAGYLLLKVLRSYIALDMYAALEVHTAVTIAAGRKELLHFSKALKAYEQHNNNGDSEKNWEFLKCHTHAHMFDDIVAKGVTKNYSTKPSEQMHGPVKKVYACVTNFKEVEPQILQHNHWTAVADYIRAQLDNLDEYHRQDDSKILDEADDPGGFIHLGAKQKEVTMAQFTKFINNFLVAHNLPRPQNKALKIQKTDLLTEYRYLKLKYESKITWRLVEDYLRCTPNFGKDQQPRHDCVIVRTQKDPIFACLVFAFSFQVGDQQHLFALIHAYDAPTGMLWRKDKDLGLIRVCARPRKDAEFIPVQSIIRGAFIVPTFESVDVDMFLRLQEMYPYLQP